jgi:hypothetical protein
LLPALFVLVSCSNDDDPVAAPQFTCSDSSSGVIDTVFLDCGAAISDTTWRVDVSIGGPSSGTTTLRGVALDLTYDPSSIEWVSEPSYTSPAMPGALVAVALLGGAQGTLVIGIQLPGSSPPAAIEPGSETLLSLQFRRKGSASFAPVPLQIENGAATGASTAINFSSTLALAYQ